MIIAAVFAIFASLLWGITNHIDKFLVSGIDESGNSIKTLLVFSTLIAGIVISPIWLIVSNFSIEINNYSLICILVSSVAYILATFLYFKALEKNDASIVVAMFQLIPVFSYFLAWLLFRERLTTNQIIGSIVIILSAVLISLDFEDNKIKGKWIALITMIISSFLYSVYFALFDLGMRNSDFNSCAFWLQIGFLIQGLFLICIKSFRTTFIKAIKNNGKKFFSINIANETLNLIANLLVNFANVTLPLAIANVLIGFQGAFVFILGLLGVKLLPKYFKEDLRKNVVLQKVGCIALSIIGLIIMFLL